MPSLRQVALGFVLLLLAACGNPGASLPSIGMVAPGPYRLDTGDLVQITVFGQEALSGELRVGDSGAVSLPLVGAVEARGRTTGELEAAIADRLREGFLQNPAVAVQVNEYRPFYILGEVSTPGRYPYEQGMTVLTAVSVAGGFTYRAQQNYVSITRTVAGVPQEGRAGRDDPVLPGDVVNVFERRW